MKHVNIISVLTDNKYIGESIPVCGWVKTIRNSKTMCFVEINDGTSLKNLQLVIDKFNEEVKDFFEKLTVGSSVAIVGDIAVSQNQNQQVEMVVREAKIIGECPQDYPIQKKKQNLETLREIPHLRVRTNTFNAVFRVRSVLSKAIHDYFQNHGYSYVNSPIITGSDCEGAGEMFRATTLDIDKVSKNKYNEKLDKDDFFGKKVSLSVSGQLEAEAMISSLGKVYTFAPSFRAENSNTKRHAAEFWIVEPEVAFADLPEIKVDVVGIVKYVVQRVLSDCPDEIAFFTKYYKSDLLNRLLQILNVDFETIEYNEVISFLSKSSEQFEYPVYWGCDLKNEHTKYLTDEVFHKPIFIENMPKELKPFYIKLNSDAKTVASSDLFFPGIGDIIGASQKEDNYEIMKRRINELGMKESDYNWYLELRKYGSVPHSGFGLGIERLLMYVTGIDNIRDTIPFPRVKCKQLKL